MWRLRSIAKISNRPTGCISSKCDGKSGGRWMGPPNWPLRLHDMLKMGHLLDDLRSWTAILTMPVQVKAFHEEQLP